MKDNAEEVLASLGFELVGEDPDDRTRNIWVYQGHLPHVRIYLDPSPSLPAVLYAIYDAGAEALSRAMDEHETAIKNLRKRKGHTTFERNPGPPSP